MANPDRLLNPLAARLRAGELGLALMIKHSHTVDIALAAKTCGFDAIYFDLQHSTIPEDVVTEVSSTAVQAGIASIVQIPERGYGTALRVLDGGAVGIVVPDMSSAADAEEAVSHCKLLPSESLECRPLSAFRLSHSPGRRSTEATRREHAAHRDGRKRCRTGKRGIDRGRSRCRYRAYRQQRSRLRSRRAGENTHTKVIAAIERVVAACRKHGKIPGMGGLSGGDPANFQRAVRLVPAS